MEAVSFGDDDKRLGSGCAAGIVKIWDVEEAKGSFVFVQFSQTS